MAQLRRKIRRKDLKQADEFISLFENAREFIEANLRAVIIAVAAVVGAALIAAGIYYRQVYLDRLAAEQFYQAFTALQAKQYKIAEQELTRLTADFPRRRLGKLGRLYLGQSYLADGDLKRARDALDAFVAESDDPAFKNLGLASLAVVYEQMGDFKKAQDAYAQAGSVSGPNQEWAELGVARMLARQGKRDEAIRAYGDFLKRHPFAPERGSVVDALAALGASPPSELAQQSLPAAR